MVNNFKSAGWKILTSGAPRSLLLQFVAVIAVWSYFVLLHWGNDGLWYQGDAPTHAMNGVFWLDFLRQMPEKPLEYALSYYARYPAINPAAYPPVFYFIEAFFYWLFGISPAVPRGIVLAFVLLGSVYLVLWLRRWVGESLGWAGILFMLQPAILVWGHAAMLNVPCTALALGALYHWRRWLEDSSSGNVYPATILALLSVLTYIPTLLILLIMFAWLLVERRLAALADRRFLIASACTLLVPLLWIAVSGEWDPGHREVGMYLGDHPFWEAESWIYYLNHLTGMVTLGVLLAALAGLIMGIRRRRCRKEVLFAALWWILCYLWFSLFSVKEPRYALLLIPPMIILGSVAVSAIFDKFPKLSFPTQPLFTAAVIFIVILVHVSRVEAVSVPKLEGFRQIVNYVRKENPGGLFFYDGYYHAVFSFYLRAADQNLEYGVVRASKLLYATKIEPKFGLVEHVSSTADVVEMFKEKCGCRYLIVERKSRANIRAEKLLRQALAGNDFRLTRTFRVDSPEASAIDIYEYTGPMSAPEYLEFSFPLMGEGVTMKAKPLRR